MLKIQSAYFALYFMSIVNKKLNFNLFAGKAKIFNRNKLSKGKSLHCQTIQKNIFSSLALFKIIVLD